MNNVQGMKNNARWFHMAATIMVSAITVLGASAQTVLLDEGLRDGILPTGWATNNVILETTAADGYARLVATESSLTTAAFDAAEYAFVRGEFAVAKYGAGDNGPITVEYRTLPAGSWTKAGDSPVPDSGTVYLDASIDIFSLSDEMQVRFTRPDSPSQKRLLDVTITGQGIAGTPLLQVSPATISGLNYLVDSGPSASQSYSLSGFNLDGSGNITVSAPTGFEVASDESGSYGSSLSLPFAAGQLTGQPVSVFVRLAAGRSAGDYSGSITHAGGGLTTPPQVALAGTVVNVIKLIDGSYTEDFDGIGDGLPPGIRVVTGATISANGTEAAFDTAAKTWGDSTGAFKNLASTVGLTSTAATADQHASDNRALGIRTGASFGDPGAGFIFTLSDTLGYNDIYVSMDLLMLSVQGRSQVWTIDYRVGTSGDFTAIGTWADPGVWGVTPFSAALGSSANDQAQPVEVRLVALSASTGGGSRDTIAIDNLVFSGSGTSSPSITVAPTALPAMQTSVGTPSTAATFTVSGSNLNGNLTVTAPAGIEIALADEDPYAATLEIARDGDSVADTTIHARLSGAEVGTYQDPITVTGGGATARTVGINGTVTLGIPVAQPASNIESVRFTANWTPVPGATAYHLDVATTPDFGIGGTESFELHTAGGTYGSGSYTGDQQVVWHYVASRNDGGFPIDGKGMMLRRLSDESRVYSEQIPGGIGSFSCRLRKAFAGAGNRQVELLVNGVSRGTSVTFDDTEIRTFTVDNINIAGDIEIRVDNITEFQVVIDDIQWTSYPSTQVPGFEDAVVDGPGTVVSGLSRETTYYYRVRATAGDVSSDWSDTISVMTRRSVPTVVILQ